jgi:uncharacterized HAD superfamily protein
MENKKIGIDIDEVISEFVKPYLEFHNNKFGTNINYEDISRPLFWEDLGYNIDEMQILFDDFQENHLLPENFPLLSGSKEGINLLNKKNKLFIITSRPKKIFEQTKKFFDKHFPENDFKIFFSGEVHISNNSKSKADICKKLNIDFLIEDGPKIALDCAKKGIKVFLMDKPWNKDYEHHNNIIKVKNWEEIVKNLEN